MKTASQLELFPRPEVRQVGVRIPVLMDYRLESLAKATMRPKGDLIREAIRKLLREYAGKMGVSLEEEEEPEEEEEGLEEGF